VQALLERDYVELKIDVDRYAHGAEVAGRLRGERGGGIPWIVITDSAGKELVTSDSPQGNIGCPVEPHEVSWFMDMLRKTRQTLSDGDLVTIKRTLEERHKQYRR
jgi:hypothetical protein